MNDIKAAKRIIAENIYMTIATATKDGVPWISPGFFAYDSDYRLYWVSNKNAKHSVLVRENPSVAIVIFDSKAPEGEGDGVYFEAKIEELGDEQEISEAMTILGERVSKDEFRVKKIEEVTNNGLWRIYRATPSKASKLGNGKIVNGQWIDQRVDIDL
ncbi:MAG: pyridoxamine 5'-phosphate oxidase family protein [Candidatus Saccharimonadia bacterium]